MIRIPVTSADFDSGRIKSSISKLSKHHPDQSVKPKRSFAQQTFAQILGYGGYEELRSQAKHNGPAYSGQSLAMEQFIAPISLRISRYWGVSSDKAEHVAAALGLIHLDAFRVTARTIQQPLMRENRVSTPGHLPNLGISLGPILDAIRLATVMQWAQLEAFQDAMKPSAAMAAIQDAMKPSAAMAAIQDAMKPSAAMAAIQDAMKPSAAMAAIQDAMKPSAAMAAIQDAMNPSAMAAIQDVLKPSAAIAAIQDALKPMAHIAALQDVMRPSSKMAAIQDALKPLARNTSDLDLERIHDDV
ncbi:hypothetical protein [Pseudomonas prosekii]|uniref:Uncharacterized protein n=1 Tax=Pseudomonas prosekii TaxID=1148509 RepID=A0A1H1R1U8_9PSED|nr:hypothetical protein [Pseudomonas prosekii]SDS29663.1 hypothetical protein SAMN05216222_1133 [Pseudomonas prosekii]